MSKTLRLLLIPVLVLPVAFLGYWAFAAEGGHDHGAEKNIYAPAMNAMHEGMDVAPTGDPDVDFVNGMIPHHQGAVEMAKIVLEHGKDPEIRKLAEGVIAAQEEEIKFMRDWLKKKGR